MIKDKKQVLRPIIESSKGIHLTAYLVNNGHLANLHRQLRQTIAEAYEWLTPIMGPDEKNKFLEPLEGLLKDSRILKDMRGNIGIFRNQNSFRLLNIPIQVEQSCQVATSFHVKPLLRWLQGDKEFLLLSINENVAQLYSGSQYSFKLEDSLTIPEFPDRTDNLRNESLRWIAEWIEDLTKFSKPKLFFAGEPILIAKLCKVLNYKNSVNIPVVLKLDKQNIQQTCESLS